MGGMPYGLAGPTAQTTGRATLHLQVAAQIESRALIQCCPYDAEAPRGGDGAESNAASSRLASNDMSRFVAPRYPAEIYEVGPQPTEQSCRFTKLINRRFPTTEVHDAFPLALSSGAAKKAVVTFGD